MSVPSDRRALQSVATQFFVNGFVYGSWVPRLPEIRDRVDITIGQLGLVLTIGAVAGVVGSFLTGPVIARLGTRRTLILGAVLSIGSLPLIGVATAPAILVLGLFGVLFFDVFIDVAMNVQGSVLSARRHAPVMNRLHGLWSLGTVAGGLVTALLAGAGVGVPVHLVVVTGALIVAVLFVAAGLLPVDEPHEAEREHEDRNRWRVGRTGSLFLIGGAAAMAMELSAGDWAAFRLSDDLGSSARVAAGAFVAFTVGMTAGRFGGDWVQVRLGALRMIRFAALLAGGAMIFATLVPNQAVSLAGYVVAGLGTAVMFPQLYDAAAKAPGPPGSGFTAMLVGQRSGALLVPITVGTLANTSAMNVGQAVAIVAIPSAAYIFASTYLRPR
jgi:fucose permease